MNRSDPGMRKPPPQRNFPAQRQEGPLGREAVGPTFPHPFSSTTGKEFRKPPLRVFDSPLACVYRSCE